jgi:transcriptional regulator with XRE-family HTH domain
MANNQLRQALEENGVRQTELSQASGVSISLISKIVNNRRTPSPTTVTKIVKGLSKIAGTEVPPESVFPNSR